MLRGRSNPPPMDILPEEMIEEIGLFFMSEPNDTISVMKWHSLDRKRWYKAIEIGVLERIFNGKRVYVRKYDGELNTLHIRKYHEEKLAFCYGEAHLLEMMIVDYCTQLIDDNKGVVLKGEIVHKKIPSSLLEMFQHNSIRTSKSPYRIQRILNRSILTNSCLRLVLRRNMEFTIIRDKYYSTKDDPGAPFHIDTIEVGHRIAIKPARSFLWNYIYSSVYRK